MDSKQIEFLKNVAKEGQVEYCDIDYDNVDKFLKSSKFKSGQLSKQEFLERNFNGSFEIAMRMISLGLLKIDNMGWKITCSLSPEAKKLITKDTILKNKK